MEYVGAIKKTDINLLILVMISCFKIPGTLEGLGDIQLITKEAKVTAAERLVHLPPNEKRLSMDEAIAIAAYTFDLGFNSKTKDGSDILDVNLNNVIRERNSVAMINHLYIN